MATAAELLTGEEIKPMPKRLHAIVQQRIVYLLTRELGLDLALPELAVSVLDQEGRNIVPDVILLGPNATFERGVLVAGADVAVEIIRPKQTFSSLTDKCERLLAAGVTEKCWIIWPEHATAFVYSLDAGLVQEQSALVVESRQVTLSLSDVVGNLPTDVNETGKSGKLGQPDR